MHRQSEDAWDGVLDGSAWRDEALAALTAAHEAAVVVLDLYQRAAAATYAKADGSPVTDADLAADNVIRSRLAAQFPGDAILTEEGRDDAARLGSERCWIVDPIDGTQQFVERTGNFDVLVALAVAGRPVVAVAVQPPTGTVCCAVSGGGAWTSNPANHPIPVCFPDNAPPRPRIATSTWFGAPENLALLGEVARRVGGECLDASRIGFTPRLYLEPRVADALLGFRVGASQYMASEWDFAVGDLFVHEAGGRLTDLAGVPFRYNKATPTMEGGLVAAVHPDLHSRLLEQVRAVAANLGIATV